METFIDQLTPDLFAQLLAEFPEAIQRRIIGQKRRKKIDSQQRINATVTTREGEVAAKLVFQIGQL